MTVGLPGSGYIEWSNNWIAQDLYGRLKFSRDDIRNMLGPPGIFIREKEAVVSITLSAGIRSALERGYDVVFCGHNLNPKVRDKWLKYAKIYKEKTGNELEVKLITFQATLDECIAYNEKLPLDKKIHRQAIERLYEKYLAPNPELLNELNNVQTTTELSESGQVDEDEQSSN